MNIKLSFADVFKISKMLSKNCQDVCKMSSIVFSNGQQVKWNDLQTSKKKSHVNYQSICQYQP